MPVELFVLGPITLMARGNLVLLYLGSDKRLQLAEK